MTCRVLRCGSLGLLLLAAALAGCAQPLRPEPPVIATGTEQAMPQGDRWVLVLTDPRSDRRRAGLDGLGYGNRGEYDADPALQRLANELSRDHQLAIVEQWPINSLKVHCVVVDVSGRGDRAAIYAALIADRRVQAVQAVHEFKTTQRDAANSATLPDAAPVKAAGSDPLRHLQTALDLLRLDALPAGLDGRGVRVAVIDSAAELRHGDLALGTQQQHDVAAGRLPAPPHGEAHGTAMAGVIAARARNGVGIRGVAPGVELQLLRACWQPAANSPAICDSLTLSRALDRCIALAPQVLNLSLSGPADPLLERLLLQLRRRGTLVVAAHDEQRGAERFPRPARGVVYAVDGSQRSLQALGDAVALPGRDVMTTLVGGSYGFVDGHSVAAAHLSAAAALLLQSRPDADAETIINALKHSTRQVGEASSVDLCAALQQVAGNASCS